MPLRISGIKSRILCNCDEFSKINSLIILLLKEIWIQRWTVSSRIQSKIPFLHLIYSKYWRLIFVFVSQNNNPGSGCPWGFNKVGLGSHNIFLTFFKTHLFIRVLYQSSVSGTKCPFGYTVSESILPIHIRFDVRRDFLNFTEGLCIEIWMPLQLQGMIHKLKNNLNVLLLKKFFPLAIQQKSTEGCPLGVKVLSNWDVKWLMF